MERKIYKSTIKDIDEKGIVTVQANAFGNVDSDGDISVKGSFKKTLSEFFPRVKWFLNHNPTQLLGVPIEGKETDKGLIMTGKMNLQKQIGRETYEDYKLYAEHDKTLEHSIGVQAIKRDTDDERKVLEWKLWEYSTLTNWGANEDTPMMDMKSVDKLNERLTLLEKKLKNDRYTDQTLRGVEGEIEKIKNILKPSIDTSSSKSDNTCIDRAKVFSYQLRCESLNDVLKGTTFEGQFKEQLSEKQAIDIAQKTDIEAERLIAAVV